MSSLEALIVRSNAEVLSLNAPGNYAAYFVILVQLLWSRLVYRLFFFHVSFRTNVPVTLAVIT